jgi:hypothetical protein
MPNTWSYHYHENGGYDCMTGAFHITCNGRPVFDLDLSGFGQDLCGDDFEARTLAQPLAVAIVEALNTQGVEVPSFGA